VRELVEMHGGQIEARNQPNGGGAVFTARFPRHAEAALIRKPQQFAARYPIASPPLDGVRVLVLDEDREAGDLVSAVLEQRGATVRTVASVADALESLEAWHPDVLLSDRANAERHSYALVGKVQSLDADRGGRIPAFALTDAARSDTRMAPLLAGVQSDIPKPIEPGLLAAEVARLAGRERRRAQR
jgi:CheY-like chemotaxis protein